MDKTAVRQMIAELRGLLNGWDPIGVFHTDLEVDWPSDEYDCLHGLVLGSLRREDSIEETARLLEEEFSDHFGLALKPADCRDAAERLHHWYQSRGDDPGKAYA